jgi:signal transduction histidine kinase
MPSSTWSGVSVRRAERQASAQADGTLGSAGLRLLAHQRGRPVRPCGGVTGTTTPIAAGGGGAGAIETRPRMVAAHALVAGGIATCAALAFAERHAPFSLGRLAILTAIASIAGAADVEIDEKLWLGPSLAVWAFGMTYLGAPALLTAVAISEFVRWPVIRSRPGTIVPNILAIGLPAAAGALVARHLALSVGTRDPIFYAVLAAVIAGNVLVNYYSLRLWWSLRFGYRARWRVAMPARLWGPNLALISTGELSIRSYVSSHALGLSVLIVGCASFVLLTHQLQDVRRIAGENAELAAARGVLLGQVLDAEDHERRYLGQVLHDNAVQTMLSARQDLDEAVEGRPDRLVRAAETIDETIRQLRDVIAELHPAVLDSIGLEAALSAVLEAHCRDRFAWSVTVAPSAEGVDDRLLFSLARELIANAAHHASATSIHVAIDASTDRIRLSVADDGVGFAAGSDLAFAHGHIGLRSVGERARAAGGEVEIDSEPGRGSTVNVSISRRTV